MNRWTPFRSTTLLTSAYSVLWVVVLGSASATLGEDKLFSGPQVGEKLPAFKARVAVGESAGKEIDLVETAGSKPMVIAFVHEFNRPSAATIRTLMNYAAGHGKEGQLVAGVIMLTDDATATEELLKRAKQALPTGVSISISSDGKEGPGALGLNRKMTLTVLVAKEGKVTANFALVQPSVQADVPKMAAAVADALGIKPPTDKELGLGDAARPKTTDRPKAAAQDPNLAPLVRAVIQKDASNDDVDAAAKKVVEYVEKNREAAKQLGQIAQRVVGSGKLENYGTARAQEHLREWAKKYGKE